MTRVAVLLAAGLSKRFGAHNKLLTSFEGQPLVAHAAAAVRAAQFDLRIAIVSNEGVRKVLDGFDVEMIEWPEKGQSESLRMGISCAASRGADSVTVVLGDMPRVSVESIESVTKLALERGAAACFDGARRAPPAAFSRLQFEKLKKMEGDVGARPFVHSLSPSQLVRVSASELTDIDVPDDIAKV